MRRCGRHLARTAYDQARSGRARYRAALPGFLRHAPIYPRRGSAVGLHRPSHSQMVPAFGAQKGPLRTSDQAVRRDTLHGLRRVLNQAVEATSMGTRIGSTLKTTLAFVAACAIASATPAFAQTGAEYPRTMPGGGGIP